MKVPKDLRDVQRAAEAAGWTVTATRKHHLKWTAPGGAMVFSSSTPSCSRNKQNTLKDLRRYGLVLEAGRR